MEHIQLREILLLTFSALSAFASPARAESVIQVHWKDACRATAGSELTITTVNGLYIEGHCLRVDDNEIQVVSPTNGVIKIARAALSRIEMQRPRNHQFASLVKTSGGALKQEAGWIFTPAAPLGIAALPATVAWAILATPFCLIGDLAQSGTNRTRQIQLI